MSSTNPKTFEVTGERMTLGQSSRRNQEDHLARYEFATSFVKEKKVLDVACGTGYGCGMYANAGASEIYGVDIDQESIAYAKEHFAAPNIIYQCSSAAKVDAPDNYFDVITTFETIEHLEAEERSQYLKELHRVLKPDGLLLLSTPNKKITSPWSEKPLNPYHVLEYYKDTLEQELTEHSFTVIEWYGQRYVHDIFTNRLVYLAVRAIEKIKRSSTGVYEIADGPAVRKLRAGYQARYFVLTISKQ